MINFLKNKWKEDRGAALAIVASSLFLLMGVASISADVAWYYLHASRVQRAADAAALAGVVYLPVAPGTANSTAVDIAFRNGYTDGDVATNTSVTPAAVSENQLQVRISTEVDTFFAKVLGWDTMTIARSAIAEYIPPLKLGSPDNTFGNNCDPSQAGCTGQSNFWANIHGRYTERSMGDAYSSYCNAGGSDQPNCVGAGNGNAFRRDTGYLYGIESPGGFTVQGNDLAFRNTSGGLPTSDAIRTGDRGCEDWGPSSAATCGPTMVITLYAPDPTPLDVSNNAVLCTAELPPVPQVAVGGPGTYAWTTPDAQACWNQSGAGIFIVQVKHKDPGNTADRAGLNRYGIRSTSGNMFALGDFSIYNNASGLTTSFYLAEVPTFYHGKTFVVELFDAGESSANGNLQVVDPTGAVFNDGQCRIYDRNTPADAWVLRQTVNPPANCQELVTPSEYNNRWLKFEMDLPATYACGSCWWKMNYVYTSGVNDTTTWRAYMIGNPIHIID